MNCLKPTYSSQIQKKETVADTTLNKILETLKPNLNIHKCLLPDISDEKPLHANMWYIFAPRIQIFCFECGSEPP